MGKGAKLHLDNGQKAGKGQDVCMVCQRECKGFTELGRGLTIRNYKCWKKLANESDDVGGN